MKLILIRKMLKKLKDILNLGMGREVLRGKLKNYFGG